LDIDQVERATLETRSEALVSIILKIWKERLHADSLFHHGFSRGKMRFFKAFAGVLVNSAGASPRKKILKEKLFVKGRDSNGMVSLFDRKDKFNKILVRKSEA